MNKMKIGITADCVCDLPQKTLDEIGVDVIPFHIVTDRGCFCDFTEITSDNVLEHISNGKKAISEPFSADEYRSFFLNELLKYDKIIHITITNGMSNAFAHATSAAAGLQDRVTVFDSYHLSTGMGLLVIEAAKLAAAGSSVEEIISDLTEMRKRVSTSFIAYSAEFLAINGKIGKTTEKFCKTFHIHPVLKIDKDGKMTLGGFYAGNYEKAAKIYIRKRLANNADIDRKRLFLTHSGCSAKMLSMLRNEIDAYDRTDITEITPASATVSSNCGPNAFGVLYVLGKSKGAT